MINKEYFRIKWEINKIHRRTVRDARSGRIPEMLDEQEREFLVRKGIPVDEDYYGIDFDFNVDTNFPSYTQLPNIVMKVLRKEGHLVYKADKSFFKFEKNLYTAKTFKFRKNRDLSEPLDALCKIFGPHKKRIVFFAAYISYTHSDKFDNFEEQLIVRMSEV